METSKAVQKAYESTAVVNEIAGNLTDVSLSMIDNQISLIFEELTETIDAFEQGDMEGLLDGGNDLFVVVSGLLQMLESRGFGVAESLHRVTDNNLTKFPPMGSVFGYDPAYRLVYNDKHKRTAILDANGKFRKPSNFVAVSLSDLVPA